MANSIDPRLPLSPIKPPDQRQDNKHQKVNDSSFRDILAGKVAEDSKLKFSRHALDRLQNRGIMLSGQDLKNLEGAVDQAAQKGSRDSLILMHDLALIVSVVNRTVVTAVDGETRKDNVFTNIDSAVII